MPLIFGLEILQKTFAGISRHGRRDRSNRVFHFSFNNNNDNNQEIRSIGRILMLCSILFKDQMVEIGKHN